MHAVPCPMLRLLCVLLPFLATVAVSAEISGIVTEVQDGDTLTLVNWSATYKIRLADIDAPEWKQERGKDSRACLFHMCGLKLETAETAGEDRYGRTYGTGTAWLGLGVRALCTEGLIALRSTGGRAGGSTRLVGGLCAGAAVGVARDEARRLIHSCTPRSGVTGSRWKPRHLP